MAVLLIIHDLGVIAQLCDDVAIMYAGSIVEKGSTQQIFENSLHPYTKDLLHSVPRLGHCFQNLATIKGVVPPLHQRPKGCRFYNRCTEAKREHLD